MSLFFDVEIGVGWFMCFSVDVIFRRFFVFLSFWVYVSFVSCCGWVVGEVGGDL